MKNNSQAMKVIFDRMRTDSAFRSRIRANLDNYDNPILAAADWEDPIGSIMGMASSQDRPLYVFLFKRGSLKVGFGMTPSEVGDDSRRMEQAMIVAPAAPIGMAIEASKGTGSMTIVVRHPEELDGHHMEASRLVFS